MKYKLTVFLFFLVIFLCNGHLLEKILSTAHEQIQSGVEDVASAVLGGLNGNIFGAIRQNYPQDVPQKGSEETIIVIVEEPDNSDYGNAQYHGSINRNPPPPHHHHHRDQPLFNHDSLPRPPPHHDHHHHHHHQRPHIHYGSNSPPTPPSELDQGPYGNPRPGYNGQNQRPYHHNEYVNNENSYNQGNPNNFPENNHYNRPSGDNGISHNNGYKQGHTNAEEHTNNNPTIYDNILPTTEYDKIAGTAKTTQLPKDDEFYKVTEKTSDDIPLFVPLNTSEYVYGGDKINITAPKRDTDKTKEEESGDEDFAIDIRLKNE